MTMTMIWRTLRAPLVARQGAARMIARMTLLLVWAERRTTRRSARGKIVTAHPVRSGRRKRKRSLRKTRKTDPRRNTRSDHITGMTAKPHRIRIRTRAAPERIHTPTMMVVAAADAGRDRLERTRKRKARRRSEEDLVLNPTIVLLQNHMSGTATLWKSEISKTIKTNEMNLGRIVIVMDEAIATAFTKGIEMIVMTSGLNGIPRGCKEDAKVALGNDADAGQKTPGDQDQDPDPSHRVVTDHVLIRKTGPEGIRWITGERIVQSAQRAAEEIDRPRDPKIIEGSQRIDPDPDQIAGEKILLNQGTKIVNGLTPRTIKYLKINIELDQRMTKRLKRNVEIDLALAAERRTHLGTRKNNVSVPGLLAEEEVLLLLPINVAKGLQVESVTIPLVRIIGDAKDPLVRKGENIIHPKSVAKDL